MKKNKLKKLLSAILIAIMTIMSMNINAAADDTVNITIKENLSQAYAGILDAYRQLGIDKLTTGLGVGINGINTNNVDCYYALANIANDTARLYLIFVDSDNKYEVYSLIPDLKDFVLITAGNNFSGVFADENLGFTVKNKDEGCFNVDDYVFGAMFSYTETSKMNNTYSIRKNSKEETNISLAEFEAENKKLAYYQLPMTNLFENTDLPNLDVVKLVPANSITDEISIANDTENDKTDTEITLIVNGNEIKSEVEPYVENGSTMVPIRVVAVALNAEVDYIASTKTVVIEKDDTIVHLPVGSTEATVNNSAVSLSSPAAIKNGSTMVPLRFVSESLGAEVNWDGNKKIITIIE